MRADSFTMDSWDFCTQNKLAYLYTNKNKKQEVGHLLFPPQKGTHCQLARNNINSFHSLRVTAVPFLFQASKGHNQ